MRRSMWLPAAVCAASVLAGGVTAGAADLGSADYAYLSRQFGVRDGGPLLKGSTADERQGLQATINDPQFRSAPPARDAMVADRLYAMYLRQCKDWSQAHVSEPCPPEPDRATEPGHQIADRQCNFCHLFGTGTAPSFHMMAVDGGWTAQRLSDAMQKGHRMSPITLQPEQVRDLAAYISAQR